MRVLVALPLPRGRALAAELVDSGLEAAATAPEALLDGVALAEDVDALIVGADPASLDVRVLATCDARGIRIVALADDERGRRLAERAGVAPALPADTAGWALAEALRLPAAAPMPATPRGADGRIVAVWGPHGAPGRSTLATEIAAELARDGGRVGLVDADAHAPSLALALGLHDEGPGFAAACRQAGLGGLDAAELDRISVPVRTAGGVVDVLTGINRPGRWPELSADRVAAALGACRSWAQATVVDVAASLERDEEIVSDLDGPRRNAATIAALEAADLVVAVCAGDPIGVARFVRAYAELRATVGATRVVVVVNRVRAATLGLDARGQVRRTLERFADIRDVWFVPTDPRSVDAAMLAGRAVADTAPRSPLAAAVRRLVGEAIHPAPGAPVRERRRTRERAAAGRAVRNA
ncbi:P-loop NTPase [Microbacterium sp. 10M-3C3]|uniref:AAA family ATPase n=1 Tax=Microbacterium sp. 10M-3C3 TaxID=2483401 RepID=UPI000F63B2A7|nr:P-loop NTPase [Microbacterium sp. 10M-3C3]